MVIKSFSAQDREGRSHLLESPLTMGYADGEPVVKLDYHFGVPVSAFRELAVAYLRSCGFLVLDPSEVKLIERDNRISELEETVKKLSAVVEECAEDAWKYRDTSR